MADFSTKKNGEGYPDPTAHDGINGRVKGGEIYQYKEYEVLALRNQGEFSTILRLVDFDSPGSISVDGSGMKYTNPAMLGYAYNHKLGRFVNALYNSDYERIMAAVHESLGNMPENRTEPDNDDVARMAQIVELKDYADRLAATNEMLSLAKGAAETEAAAAKIKCEVFEKLYNDLLYKVLAKGAAETWQTMSNG